MDEVIEMTSGYGCGKHWGQLVIFKVGYDLLNSRLVQ